MYIMKTIYILIATLSFLAACIPHDQKKPEKTSQKQKQIQSPNKKYNNDLKKTLNDGAKFKTLYAIAPTQINTISSVAIVVIAAPVYE